ncbi:phycobiliprotein lyase [Trichothermofontia sichuanensis B231]|uniref:phycobiliprotein lyase n=1 Tax=Trichothermofontia sichuanensis TaxID=3045816 RepID=UPI0022454856|nr:phycobiliprotein lyase [Trichothermofontia sichuanensis]UZQ55919.1 phycobiliprotein lyase [Trichothermofontia sichuanensis B231]
MNIIEFFEANAGKWLSQRTSHNLAWPGSESGKAEVQIDLLTASQPEVIQLCQQGNLAAAQALCGARITWKGMMAAETQQQIGTTLLVALATGDNLNQGQLLQQNGRKGLLSGRYLLGSDEVLTLTTASESLYLEERLWFAGPNLRLRTSLLKQPNGFSSATFCSEIRIGGSQSPAAVAPVVTSSAS